MSIYDVLDVLLQESSLREALLLLLVVLLLYFIAFRRRFESVFDPLVYVLALSAVAQTLLLLMGLHELVSITKVVFVAGCLTLFYAGFLLVDTSKPRVSGHGPLSISSPSRHVASGTLVVLFLADLFVLGTTYTFFGVPLLLESRLSQFAESGGFGVLSRLRRVSSSVLSFSLSSPCDKNPLDVFGAEPS
jgi:hypothetical protein